MTLETMENSEQMLIPIAGNEQQTLEISGAAPVRFQTLDVARHVAIAPNGKRYVVATFNDQRLKRDYVTAIYPQQGGYLTLLRLVIVESSSETIEEAIQKHTRFIQMIQQGKLQELLVSLAN
jgi:hypothetical protein